MNRLVTVKCWATNGKQCDKEFESCEEIFSFFGQRLRSVDFYITHNGKVLDRGAELETNGIYHVVPKLPGGKGGFGSMLRAIGAQIEKTTSREACRDLSGRRMRDVNNEKKLKEWISKKADREREKEEKRKERFERRRAVPNHRFDDPQYDLQKAKVKDNLEDALQAGLKKSSQSSSTSSNVGESRKRKSDEEIKHNRDLKKKAVEWLGMSIENVSDLDTSSDDSDSDTADSPSSSDMQLTNTEVEENENTIEKTESVNSSSDQNISSADASLQSSTSKSGLLTVLEAVPPASNTPQVTTDVRDVSEPVNLESYSSAEQLKECGLDRLKTELISRGLKCGGTLEERAFRLFSVKGLNSDQYPAALKAKPAKGKKVK